MGSKPTSIIPTKALGSTVTKKDCFKVCVINNARKKHSCENGETLLCLSTTKSSTFRLIFVTNTKVHSNLFLMITIMRCLSLKPKLSYSYHSLRLKSASKLHSRIPSIQTTSKMLPMTFYDVTTTIKHGAREAEV